MDGERPSTWQAAPRLPGIFLRAPGVLARALRLHGGRGGTSTASTAPFPPTRVTSSPRSRAAFSLSATTRAGRVTPTSSPPDDSASRNACSWLRLRASASAIEQASRPSCRLAMHLDECRLTVHRGAASTESRRGIPSSPPCGYRAVPTHPVTTLSLSDVVTVHMPYNSGLESLATAPWQA